jgi:hypothetical protein
VLLHIGLNQFGRWPLHRVAQLLEQLAHMPGTIIAHFSK